MISFDVLLCSDCLGRRLGPRLLGRADDSVVKFCTHCLTGSTVSSLLAGVGDVNVNTVNSVT